MIQELMTLVDENDNLIWYKERWILDYDKDIYRVSALRLENPKWEVLIAQRSYSKKNQWWKRWPAVAWTVNDKEDYEQNIIKESQEKIWLKLEDYKIWPKKFIKSINQNRKYFCQRFTAKTDKKIEEFKLQREEVESIKRISKKDLLERLKNNPHDFTHTANEYIKLFCNQNYE